MTVQGRGQRLCSDWPAVFEHVAPRPKGQGEDDPAAQEGAERRGWA